jgi:hypothetical protein
MVRLFAHSYHTVSDLLAESINHPLVAKAINRVVAQANAYRLAIAMSLETAQDGHTIASDALLLCGFVSDGTASVQHLKQFVQEMLVLADKAEGRALETQKQFRAVRVALYKVLPSSHSLRIQY